MDKLNRSLIWLSLVVIFFSCEKETKEDVIPTDESTSENIEMPAIETIEGVMVLTNFNEATEVLNKFHDMTSEQRSIWSKANNFKSQKSIEDELINAQLNFEKTKYAGVDNSLTIEEMRSIGLEPELCPEILSAEAKGLVKVHKEDDGSMWFELAVIDNGYAPILNERGFVVIGEQLLQFTNNEIKHTVFTSVEDFEKLARNSSTNEAEGVFVLSEEERVVQTYTIGNIFDQTCNCWTWYYNSGSERFRHFVYFNTYWDSFSHYIYSTLKNDEKAQKQLLGIWMVRNTYKPLDYVTGDWDFKTTDPLDGVNPNYLWSTTGYAWPNPSQVNETYGPSNEEIEFMYPNGPTLIPHPNSAVAVYYNLHIHGSFYGGSSGYSTDYYY